MVNFDATKVQGLSDDVQKLRDSIFHKLYDLFPAAQDNNWSKEDVTVTISSDQPARGLKIRLEYPCTVASHTKLNIRRSARDVTIFPDGSTDFPGLTIGSRAAQDLQKKILAGV